MIKRMLIILALAFVVTFSVMAASDGWYYGMEIKEFTTNGIQNISEYELNNILYPYRLKVFSDELFTEIQEKLYSLPGVDFFTADAEQIPETGELRIVFDFYELPMFAGFSFDGNEAVKTKDLKEALSDLQRGSFIDPSNVVPFELAKTQIQSLYFSKGYQDVPVSYDFEMDEASNTYKVVFHMSEGNQTRIVSIRFEGNENIDSATLRKQVSSKVKSLFNNGYLDPNKLKADASSISAYYQTNGFIDVIVSDPVIEHVESSSTKYEEVNVTFRINEGLQWFYGGMEVIGNTIFSDDAIRSVLTMKQGSVLNLESVQKEYSAVADLYYNDGYISNGMNVFDERDDTTMTVKYYLQIIEGGQATVQDVVINGLEKTKDYVMRRELTIEPGDIFSKAKLVTSAQNLYNTGLISNLDYNLMYGSDENNVLLEFNLEEGSTKDIQFGATFGGTLNGFPVSGFVQWADHNLGGRGQEFDISSTISPDTQSVSLTFGDKWFKQYRWANSLTFGFSHTRYDGELQLGAGATEYYTGRNNNDTWPLGYDSAAQWELSGNEYPSQKDLMSYDLMTFSLGYSTGYTFIYDYGRLTLSGGANVSINKAIYDSKYQPFEKLIYKYGQKWQFSNRLSFGVQWDGRDYITNTTKGYVLSSSMTYAGGLLGGLSNYIKLSSSAAGYLKVFSFTNSEDKVKNIMLCASTSASIMLPQLYNYENNGLRFYNPKLGATKYEMLYIDGMTIGRGFRSVVDQSFLWDNMLELSYMLVDNVVQAEAFISATGVNRELTDIKGGLNWYYSAGAGIKLKIAGFPLGLYMVKNATYKFDNVGDVTRGFQWYGGSFFHGNRETSGMSLVLAISTSLI